jgi:hypothetical protein
MDKSNVFWTAEGEVVIEIAGRALILSRVEAEILFTDLGHTLRDMHDCMDNYAEDIGEQPDV